MNKKTRKTRLVNKFIRIFSLSFLLFVIVAAIGTIIYVQVASNNIFSKLKGEDLNSSSSATTQGSLTEGVNHAILEKKITTVAIFGVDKQGWRTDVVMIAIFNHQTYDIDIISIPRDTQITIPTEIYEEIKASRSDIDQVERINNIPAYVEEKKRNDTSVAILEEVFDLSIDYYVNLDLNGFKYIVDAVGPIMVDVPMDMKYNDLEQDLIINLDKGLQEINGARAEQLIRYRKGYANADIGRIDTQHLFMKAFMEKILEPDQKFNMTSIIQTVLVNVTTDFKDAVDYLTFLDKLSADKVHMVTIPGGGGSGGSYEYDSNLTAELFQEILTREPVQEVVTDTEGDSEQTSTEPSSDEEAEEPEETQEEIVLHSAKDFAISVQNGTYVSGLASKVKEELTGEGYNIVDASNYSEKPIDKTKIFVPYQEVGDELSVFFNDPEIIVDLSYEEQENQIVIAIGITDSEVENE